MKKYPLVALAVGISLALTGCNDEKETTKKVNAHYVDANAFTHIVPVLSRLQLNVNNAGFNQVQQCAAQVTQPLISWPYKPQMTAQNNAFIKSTSECLLLVNKVASIIAYRMVHQTTPYQQQNLNQDVQKILTDIDANQIVNDIQTQISQSEVQNFDSKQYQWDLAGYHFAYKNDYPQIYRLGTLYYGDGMLNGNYYIITMQVDYGDAQGSQTTLAALPQVSKVPVNSKPVAPIMPAASGTGEGHTIEVDHTPMLPEVKPVDEKTPAPVPDTVPVAEIEKMYVNPDIPKAQRDLARKDLETRSPFYANAFKMQKTKNVDRCIAYGEKALENALLHKGYSELFKKTSTNVQLRLAQCLKQKLDQVIADKRLSSPAKVDKLVDLNLGLSKVELQSLALSVRSAKMGKRSKREMDRLTQEGVQGLNLLNTMSIQALVYKNNTLPLDLLIKYAQPKLKNLASQMKKENVLNSQKVYQQQMQEFRERIQSFFLHDDDTNVTKSKPKIAVKKALDEASVVPPVKVAVAQPIKTKPIVKASYKHKKKVTQTSQSNSAYSVQVGAFSNPNTASKLVRSLNRKGYEAKMVKTPRWHKVLVATHGRKDAVRIQAELSAIGFKQPVIIHN